LDYISKYPNGEAVDAQLDKADHANRATLEKFSESGGQPLFDGNPISGGKNAQIEDRLAMAGILQLTVPFNRIGDDEWKINISINLDDDETLAKLFRGIDWGKDSILTGSKIIRTISPPANITSSLSSKIEFMDKPTVQNRNVLAVYSLGDNSNCTVNLTFISMLAETYLEVYGTGSNMRGIAPQPFTSSVSFVIHDLKVIKGGS